MRQHGPQGEGAERRRLSQHERSSQIFVFTNKRRDRIRLLYWDGSGLWLMTKRLEQGTFAWPQPPEGAAKVRLKPEALEPERSGDRQPAGCPKGEGAAGD
jgi:transposase